MKSSTNRALVAKKQSTFSAQVATNLLNVLQGYTKGIRLLLVMFLTLTVTTNAWAETKTEGFEQATTGTNYQGTVTVNTQQSDCGIGWTIYYGCVSTSSKISGNNSAALRLYTSSNYGYLKTTTPIDGLSNVTFNAKAATSNSAKIKVNISYSKDGSTWTNIKSDETYGTTSQSKSYDIPSGGKYFQIAISSNSTKPSKSNAQLTIDDIVFTYTSSATPDPVDPTATFSNGSYTVGGSALDLSTLWTSNSDGAVTYSIVEIGTTGASINGKSFTATAAGQCTVQASQAKTASHNAITKTATITVNAAAGGGGGDCTWELVTDASSLSAGDVLVITSNTNAAVAGDITSQYMSKIGDITFSNDKSTITTLPANAIQLTLGGSSGAWTLANSDGDLLGATAEKKLAWDSGTTTWSISISDNNATIQNGTSSYGRFLYNTSSPRFTTYTSNASASMLLPQIYKEVCEGGSTDPTYTLTLSSTMSCVTNGSATVVYNATALSTFTPATRDGFTCDGYWSAPSGGVKVLNADGTFAATNVQEYITDGKWTNEGNVTLTPRWVCSNTMTLSVGTQSGGTYSLSKTSLETCDCTDNKRQVTITATPNSGYSVTDISYSGDGTATKVSGPTVNGENTEWVYQFTQGDNGDGTFTVTFTTIPTYTITWKVNGTALSGDALTGVTTSVIQGGSITTLPSAPTAPSGCSEKGFVGWTDSEISEETDIKPTTLFTDAASAPAIDGDKTFHAVFADEEGDNFSLGQSGDFKIYANINDTYHYAKEDAAVDKIPSTMDSNEATIYTFTKETIDGKEYYSIYNGSKYIGYNSSTNLKETAEAEKQYWSIEEGTHGSWRVTSKNTSTRALAYRASTYNTFRAYSTNNIDGNEYYDIEIGGGTTYSAYTTLCDATKATITYDLNGGTGATCERQTVTKGEAFTLCNQTPTKAGYNFAGWTDGVNTYNAGASTSVTDNTKFYAKWTAKTITITWNQNYTDCPEPIEMQYVYDSDENTMPEEPVREGYQFVGWFTGVTDGIEITEIGEENRPTDNVIYYAHWNELYSVTFMVSGQVYVVQEDKYINGDAIELPAEPSAANYACDGYIFDGWSDMEKPTEEATKPNMVTASTTVIENMSLYAVWKKASTEGTGGYITDVSQIVSGTKYYIVSSDEDKMLKAGNFTEGQSGTMTADADFNDDSEAWLFTSTGTDKQWYIYNGTEYLNTAAASNNLFTSSTQCAWTASNSTTNGMVQLSHSDNGRYLTYYSSGPNWRAYANAQNIKLYSAASYTYTTHPNCGPTIVAKDDMWVTSSNGQSVKINVPIAVKSFTNTATITGTSTNENFVVAPLENVTNGINDVVEVIYTPTTADTKEETTITLTAKNGEEILTTTTFTLNGRSLPDEFVIVAQYNDKWLAVPANMQSGADQYNGLEVTPNNTLTQIPAAPSTTIYSLRGVADSRYEAAGNCVRLVGNGNKCLWGNAATTNTTIQNWTTLGATNGSNYEWLLTTSDGEQYTIANPAHPDYNEGRILSNLGSKYGLYKGTTKFYILPVGCSSLPGNIQVTARRVDATFSWEGNASSMKIDVYTNDAMTEGKISNTATASPYYMTGLSESTQYWFKMTPNGTDDACAYTGSFKTTGPTIDVVEWQENAAVIFVDKDEELNPLVIIDGEVEHGVGTGSQATELFFSKYFEAHAENKLLAIYNGTANTINLTGYVIRQENAELDLALYGKTKGEIAPNEEIILVYFDATYSAESCAERQDNYETWNVLNDKSVLAFSGRGSIGLYKNNVLIDVIGSTFPSGELTKIGKSGKPDYCGTEEDVRLYVDGFSVNDQSSFFCNNGDNIKTPEVENDYAISTNRCLLIRKNSVTSGANAVANNKATAGAACGELSSTFTTLCTEWSGFRIGGGKSSDEEIREATCDGLGYVGGFDYNQYYKEYQNVQSGQVLHEYDHNPATKEYTIPITDLAKYSCLNIRFQLKQGDQVLTEEPVQVPIIVSGEKATNDAIFNEIVKTDGDKPLYEQSKERCKTCNVVVLSDATLTKATDGTTNDVAEVYNMKVYPGGQVVVPASTEYTVNSLAFRRQEDEVSMANIQGTLNVKHANGVYLDVRIDPSNWHYMTLPYDCRVGDITFADGTPAVVNTDYLLGWYDGAYRAEHKTGGWTYITDNDYILKKGLGYIVALPGDGKVRREIRFPMANDVIAEDLTGKTVSGLYAYGGDKTDAELRPNHKGWNMIGSPYLYTYTTEDIVKEPLQMGTLEHSPVNPWDGTWVRTGEARYIVEPIDNGWSGYRQTTISNLKPFTSYFIQVGGVKNGEEYTTVTPETEQQIVFAANSVARNASAPRKVAEAEVTDNHPVWYGVEMIAPNNEKDNTTLLISNEFTDGYDMMDDLVKMRGDYYQYYNFPVLASRNNEGEMAFNALPDSTAAKIGVPLNYYAATAGTYTIATDGKFDLEEVKAAMLYDATTAQYTNLLTDNYSFTTNKGNNTNRFTLFVIVERKKVPNITTGMDNLLANGQLSLIAIERTLVLSGLTENADIYVYDMNGKLITGMHTAGENGIWRTTVPATGVYFVRVNSANNQQTLRTIVK